MARRLTRIPKRLLIPAVLLGPLVGFATYRSAAELEARQARAHLSLHAEHAASAVKSELRADLEVLYSLKSYFETVDSVTSDSFSAIARRVLERHSSIQALEWLPRVTRDARPAYEQGMRAAGHPDFTITERSPSGQLVTAGDRELYFPVSFLYPTRGNEPALGYDVASEELRARALARAATSGKPVLTDRIALVQGSGSSPGFLGILAVFDRIDKSAARSVDPVGYVVAVYRFEDLIREALGRGDSDLAVLDFELVDVDRNGSQPVGPVPEGGSGRGPAVAISLLDEVDIGGQGWNLIVTPSAPYLATLRTRQPVMLGVVATLGWELALGLVFVLAKRSRDHLERKHARRVVGILESLSDGVIVADRQGRVLFANRAAATVSGTNRPNLSPSEWSDAHGFFLPGSKQPFPPEDLPLARAIRGETVDDVELRVCNQQVPEGMDVSVRGGPLLDTRGQVRGGVVVFRDITQRKTVEEHIRRLSNVVEQTADAVVITDRTGTIEYVNPAFETATGYAAEEALGQNPRILKSGLQSPEFYSELWSTITSGATFRGMTINRRKNGELYHAEQTITPMTDASGEITHFVSVLKDMTERRKIQEQEIELELASLVQQRLYPDSQPEIPGYDLAGAVFPADATCGDYYDFVPLPDGAVAIVVADVSGHGLGPALVMAETRAYLRSLTRATDDLVEIAKGLNGFLFADLHESYFVTMLLARLNPATGRLDFVSSAHPDGYVIGSSGELVTTLSSKCLPLGLFSDRWRCVTQEAEIEPGGLAVFVTDGVLECESSDGEEFGGSRLLETVIGHRGATAADIVSRILQAVRDFSGGSKQEDDITVVVCKRNPSRA